MNTKKTVLITGGSKGIGYEFAKLFAKDNYRLVLVARDEKKLLECFQYLTKNYNTEVITISKDLSLPSASQELYDKIKSDGINVDVLVNNAGIGVFGAFSETDLKKELSMIELNVISLVYLTKLFLKDMVAQNNGKILNIASTAGFQPIPLFSLYAATKAFVLFFSEALSEELRGNSNVSVTTLCPGAVDTDFKTSAHMENSKNFKGKMLDVQTVAKIGYKGLMKNKRLIIPGIKNKILAFSVRFLPRGLVLRVAKSQVENN
jgi:uncharacterized protein